MCPDYGPDSDHYYGDEDTGEYRVHCSCGHLDPRAYPSTPSLALAADDNPPF